MTISTALFLALLMLTLSFFFSGVEIAFLSANRLKIELKLQQGRHAARWLSALQHKVGAVHTAILIGNNIALVIFTLMVEFLLRDPLMEIGITETTYYLLYTLILSVSGTLLVLIFAEYIPKAIFKSTADRIIFPATYPLNFFYQILRPLVWVTNLISRFFLRYVLRVRQIDEPYVLGPQDLDIYIRKVIAHNEDQEAVELDTELLHNALEFRDAKIRDFMVPRTRIGAVPVTATVDELMETFVETQHSKIIVHNESLDDIKGYVHSSSMFALPEHIDEVVQALPVVPESMPAEMLLIEFNEHKKTIALVVDEFGGTAGIVTMEDLVEEIFGDIEDEYDETTVDPDQIVRRNADGTYLLGGSLEISELNEELGLSLPSEEYYNTLAGLFIYAHEDIPKINESVIVGDGYKLTAVRVTQRRILQVGLQQLVG